MDPYEDLSVVIPVKDEDWETLRILEYKLINMGIEVITVDDGSKKAYPNYKIRFRNSRGYGEALMAGIKRASRPLVLTMDGDGQHQIQDVEKLYKVWHMLDVDMVVGSRRLNYEKPLRMWGRKLLNFIASLFTGIFMQDLNSGMRIFKRDIAIGYFPILCKRFSFTTSITMSYMCDDYKVEWFPIKVAQRPHGKSHVKVVKDGLVTLKYILWIGLALRTRRIRAWLRSLR